MQGRCRQSGASPSGRWLLAPSASRSCSWWPWLRRRRHLSRSVADGSKSSRPASRVASPAAAACARSKARTACAAALTGKAPTAAHGRRPSTRASGAFPGTSVRALAQSGRGRTRTGSAWTAGARRSSTAAIAASTTAAVARTTTGADSGATATLDSHGARQHRSKGVSRRRRFRGLPVAYGWLRSAGSWSSPSQVWAASSRSGGGRQRSLDGPAA